MAILQYLKPHQSSGWCFKPPAINPAPGLFAWKTTVTDYEGRIVYPLISFFGVHADVGSQLFMNILIPNEG